MCVVVSQQNAHKNSPQELVDIYFTLLGLMLPDEPCHLSIRTFIFSLGRPPQELIELFKMNFFAAPHAIKSADQQAFPMDLLDRGNFDFDDFIRWQKNSCCAGGQVLQFDQMFQFRRSKFRDVGARLATLSRTELLAFLHCKQFRLDARNRGAIGERCDLLACTVRQIGCAFWLRIDYGDGARAIQPERQQPRETVIPPDSECARLCPRQPCFGDQIVEEGMQAETVVWLRLAR
jgi:hypothetical protein